MRGWIVAGMGLALGATLGIAGKAAMPPEHDAAKAMFRERPTSAKRNQRLRSGKETVLVLIGSSTCGASSERALPGAIEQISHYYRDSTRMAGGSLATLGIALDWDLNAGAGFLNAMGTFDEISLGRNWLNSGAVNLIWRDLPGDAALPQLVLLERGVTVSSEVIQITSDVLVRRWVGVPAILRVADDLKRRAAAPQL